VFHESNSIAPAKTKLDDFQAFQFKLGNEILRDFPGTNTELGGFVTRAGELAFELIPTIFAFAVPSGPVTRTAFEHICRHILDAAADKDVDGIFLSLHGALVVEDALGGDSELLQRVRAVAPQTPLVATFDLHANWTDAGIAAADILIGYDTFPHRDFAERGREAANLLDRMLRTGSRPAKAHIRLPLLTVPLKQCTDDEPMRSVMNMVRGCEEDPGVWTCSAAPGFVYADVPHLGFLALAYGEPWNAKSAVDAIARKAWSLREDFLPSMVSPEDGVRSALEAARPGRPAVLVESSDNVGGGSPGDSTHVLSALIAADAGPSVVVIWDPAAAATASAAADRRYVGPVGGRAGPLSGAPVEVAADVIRSGEFSYVRTSSYMTGQRVSMGLTAVVRVGRVTIVLTSNRMMPFDADHLTCLGIAPEEQSILCVKSGSAWLAAFGSVASTAIFIDSPGVCASDVRRMPYTQLHQPMFPLQQGARPQFTVITANSPTRTQTIHD
jgi:microcystin degradation protein MlrC